VQFDEGKEIKVAIEMHSTGTNIGEVHLHESKHQQQRRLTDLKP